MPNKIEREPVERFKLSKTQIAWAKRFKEFRRMADFLQKKMEAEGRPRKEPLELLRATVQGLDILAQSAPPSEVKELYGQPEAGK